MKSFITKRRMKVSVLSFLALGALMGVFTLVTGTPQAATVSDVPVSASLGFSDLTPTAGESFQAVYTLKNTTSGSVTLLAGLADQNTATGQWNSFTPQEVTIPADSQTQVAFNKTVMYPGPHTSWVAVQFASDGIWHDANPLSNQLVRYSYSVSEMPVSASLGFSDLTPNAGESLQAVYTLKNTSNGSATVLAGLADLNTATGQWNSFTPQSVTIPANSQTQVAFNKTVMFAGPHTSWIALQFGDGIWRDAKPLTNQLVRYSYTVGAALPVVIPDTTGPELTAVAHNEGEKTITYTYSEPIHFETEHGNVVTEVSPDILNIFVSTSGDYGLDTVAADVAIAATTFNDDSTVLTVTYTGTLVHGNTYIVDSWVADVEPGDGGYDIKDAAGNVDVDGVSPEFTADTIGPSLVSVNHNVTAKTITLTYSEAVHFESEHGNVVTPVTPDMLNIFASLGGDYDLDTIATGATITGTSFNGLGTVLSVTYTGTLEKEAAVATYVVDSWTAEGGWDIKDASGNTDTDGVSPEFTVLFAGPQLAAVAHNEIAKTITYIYNEPVHFESEHGNVVTPVSPDMLNIFVVTDGDYSLDTIAPDATITSVVFSSNNTVLTVTYSGTLVTSDPSTDYVVDSWFVDTDPTCPGGAPEPDYNDGFDFKDEAGNTDVDGPVSPVFTVIGNGVPLEA